MSDLRVVAEVVGFAFMGLVLLAALLGCGEWIGRLYERLTVERES